MGLQHRTASALLKAKSQRDPFGQASPAGSPSVGTSLALELGGLRDLTRPHVAPQGDDAALAASREIITLRSPSR
jgi:hypothetical protein